MPTLSSPNSGRYEMKSNEEIALAIDITFNGNPKMSREYLRASIVEALDLKDSEHTRKLDACEKLLGERTNETSDLQAKLHNESGGR